jgi:hypothetical protein
VCTGHFAECYTRQRGALPSVRTIALGKEPRPGHRYRFFAECSGSGTRQRSSLCRVSYKALGKEPDMGIPLTDSLPSAGRQTLGKDVVSVTRRRGGCFSLPSTSWHSTKSLSSARKKYSAKKALPMHCVPSSVCRVRHSSKTLPSVFKALPSASGTRQSRRFR